MAIVVRSGDVVTTMPLRPAKYKDVLSTVVRDLRILSVFNDGDELSATEIKERLDAKGYKIGIKRALVSLRLDGKVELVVLPTRGRGNGIYRYRRIDGRRAECSD